MVFSSIPSYLDPLNWNQHIAHQPPGSPGNNHLTQLQPLMPEPPPQAAGLQPGPIRPVSMSERARLAKIPQTEPALKCPRCESTNTKFCYFNNYSLTQPRHFCKTCRRYWTRGGSLRNVPVGGGCRRTRRSKASTSSKSSSSAAVGASSSSTSTGTISPTILPPLPQLPFISHFDQPLSDYSETNIGLGFSGIHANIDSVAYQLGNSGGSHGLDQWKLQQIHPFAFMGGLETSPVVPQAVPGYFAFDEERCRSEGFSSCQLLSKGSTSGLISQLASVKMEDSHELNFEYQHMGVPGNDQYWGGNSGSGSVVNGGGGTSRWVGHLSGFNSSGNIL